MLMPLLLHDRISDGITPTGVVSGWWMVDGFAIFLQQGDVNNDRPMAYVDRLQTRIIYEGNQ